MKADQLVWIDFETKRSVSLLKKSSHFKGNMFCRIGKEQKQCAAYAKETAP